MCLINTTLCYSYWTGMIHTIEKRFDLPSTRTGIPFSMNDIIQSCTVIFIGYLAPRLHVPRFLSFSMIFSCIGMFMCASPYIIYGPKYTQEHVGSPDGSSHVSATSSSICQTASHNLSIADTCTEIDSAQTIGSIGQKVYTLFLAAGAFVGLGFSGMFVLSISYIDNNVHPNKVAAYIGMLLYLSQWL